MYKKYRRTALTVEAVKYETGKGIEDGFALWKDVVLHGYTENDHIIKITRPDKTVVSPYIQSSRGAIYLREGDYIIKDRDGSRHCCGARTFNDRYQLIETD